MLSPGQRGSAPVYWHALGHATYERHRPEQTLLYQLERQGLLEQDTESAWLELEPADDTDAMPQIPGIHASEQSGVLPLQDCPPDAFLSIASQDERLKIAQGRYVCFTEWESPRRETVAHVVFAVLQGAGGSLALEEIAARVENRIGRKIDKPVISGALQALEAEFNDATGEWSLSSPSENDDEDTAELSDDASLHARQASL